MSASDGKIKIRVCALPVQEDERHAYLTHFQIEKDPEERAATAVVRCDVRETVRDVKRAVEKELGERVDILKRGGAPNGIVLEDDKTLEELGLTRDMSVWEHLWVDSEERQARMAADREKMLSFINVRPNDLTPRVLRALKELDPVSSAVNT
jgi:hypothetical protein